MVIKELINVKDGRLIDGLSPVVRIMAKMENLSPDESVELDFSRTVFTTPVCILSLIVYLTGFDWRVSFSNITPYLETVGFRKGGIMPDKMSTTAFLSMLERYSAKTYVPIVNFPAGAYEDEKKAISSLVEDLIIRQSSVQPNVANGLKYMVGETIDNITEHSGSQRGLLFAQSYPNKGYLDICIADRGVTLLGSYKRLKDNEITSDLEAIKAANRGVSSKNLPDAENRGYGIYTSKKMLVEGLMGQYMMISGESIYIKTPGYDSFINMPSGYRFKGTVVALRIPFTHSGFNYINYVE